MDENKNAPDAVPEDVDYTANNGCIGNPITNFLLLEAETAPAPAPEAGE